MKIKEFSVIIKYVKYDYLSILLLNIDIYNI